MQENISKVENQRNFVIRFSYWFIITAVVFFLGKHMIPVLIPFIIAFIVAGILNKPINYISQKTKIKRKIVSVISLLLFVFCSSILVSYFCSFIFGAIESIFSFLPDLFDNFIIPLIEQAFARFHSIDLSLLDVLQNNASTVLESINQAVSHFSNSILSSLANIISVIPTLFMQTIITIIAMFFITIDFKKIIDFCRRQIPDTKKELVLEIKNYFIHTLPKVMVSYGFVLCLTFIELFIGFHLLKIPYAGLLALLIAVLDILPVLGTGTILIPWGIICLLIQNYPLAAGIFLLYIAITIIRNIVEPKLIGKQMGLHPVLTLISMLTGLRFLGIWGLFGFPIAISFIKKLNDNGTIHVFK